MIEKATTEHMLIFTFVLAVASFAVGYLLGQQHAAIRVMLKMRRAIEEEIVPSGLIAFALNWVIERHRKEVRNKEARKYTSYQATVSAEEEE